MLVNDVVMAVEGEQRATSRYESLRRLSDHQIRLLLSTVRRLYATQVYAYAHIPLLRFVVDLFLRLVVGYARSSGD